MPRYKEILDNYKQEYGLRMYRKIDKHISNSSKTKKLIRECIKENAYPHGEGIVETVLAHFRYSFAASETVLAASLILLRNLIEAMENTVRPLKEYEIEKVEKQIFVIYQEI